MGEQLKIRIGDKTLNPGYISDDGKRITMNKEDKHVYNNLNSFGINSEVLNHLINKGIEEIVIIWHKSDNTEELFKTRILDWKLGHLTDHGDVQLHLSINTLRELTEKYSKKVVIL